MGGQTSKRAPTNRPTKNRRETSAVAPATSANARDKRHIKRWDSAYKLADDSAAKTDAAAERANVLIGKLRDGAKMVHTISARPTRSKQAPAKSTAPDAAAERVRRLVLQHHASTKVFVPFVDGDAEMWRTVGLECARRTGGRVVQLITAPGPSDVQKLEQALAAAQGVETVTLDFSDLRGVPTLEMLEKMEGWVELSELSSRVAKGERLPASRTRQQLEQHIRELERKLAHAGGRGSHRDRGHGGEAAVKDDAGDKRDRESDAGDEVPSHLSSRGRAQQRRSRREKFMAVDDQDGAMVVSPTTIHE